VSDVVWTNEFSFVETSSMPSSQVSSVWACRLLGRAGEGEELISHLLRSWKLLPCLASANHSCTYLYYHALVACVAFLGAAVASRDTRAAPLSLARPRRQRYSGWLNSAELG
jgi:hypothetical protein